MQSGYVGRTKTKTGLIKIDVQGFEYNVLKGGQETLRAYEPVLLIESFRDDERTVKLASELNYEEYHFDGSSICKGSPVHGPNSFLLTPGRFNALFSNNVTFLVRKVDVAAA